MAMASKPDEDYMFIKDTGEARDLRTIQVKELQAIVRSLYKSYGYHRKEYETGFNPPERSNWPGGTCQFTKTTCPSKARTFPHW